MSLIQQHYQIGFIVSIVFFSDPSVIAVIHELALGLKRRYVDDYFSVDIRSISDDEETGTSGTLVHSSGKFRTGQDSYRPKSDDKRAMTAFPDDKHRPQETLKHSQSDTTLETRRSCADVALMLLDPRTPDSEATSSNGSSSNNSSLGRKTIMVGELMSKNEITVSDRRRSTFPQLPHIKKPSPTLEDSSQRRKRHLVDMDHVQHPAEQLDRSRSRSTTALNQPRSSFISSLFPCITSNATSDPSDLKQQQKRRTVQHKRSHSVPMHRVTASTDSRFHQQFNKNWPLESDNENSRVNNLARKRASLSGNLWRSMEDPRNLVEPYSHPRFAMAMHFFLVNVCRINPSNQEDDDQISVEMTESVMPNRKSLAESLSENLYATRRRQSQQQQQQREGQPTFIRPRMLRGDTVDTFSTFGSQMPDNALLFPRARRTDSPADMIQMEEFPKSTLARRAMSEIKGKAPMRMFHPRDTDYFHQPMSPTQALNDPNSDQPDGTAPQQQPSDHFVFKVTDSSSPEPHHQEILSPTRAMNNTMTPDAQPFPIRPRPKLLERISEPTITTGRHAKKSSSSESPVEATTALAADASGKGGRSIFQHVLVRGVSPTSRSFKVAKQIAKRGDSTSAIRFKSTTQQQQQQPSQQPAIITTDTQVLSPSPILSSSSQTPSSYNSRDSTLCYPHDLTARPRSRQPTVAAPRFTSNEQDQDGRTQHPECHKLRGIPRFLAADFGRLRSTREGSMEKQQDYSQQQQQEEYERRLNELRKYQASQKHALDQHHAITVGFSFGVTRSVYVGNWDNHGRINVVEEQWDIDALIERFINAHHTG